MAIEIGRLTRLVLGMEGESNARTIEINMEDWLEDWPDAAVGLLLMRPGEETFYPAATTMQGNVVRYVPTRADVEIPGEGLAQIVLTDANDLELRSRVVKTVVEASLPGSVADTPDEPMQPFVDQVLDAAARAEQAAKDAEEHKLDGVSPIVETSKSGKVTTIKITDAEGIKTATISDGADGAPGAPGRDGVDGKTPVKGVDYFDGQDGAPGRDGVDGSPGRDGVDGAAATVRIGTVTTLEPGSNATVRNSGTNTNAVLDFGIPRGADGEDGAGSGEAGLDGFSPIAKVTQTSTGATITITDKDGTTTASVSNGKDGAKGDTGDPGAPGVSPTVTTSKSGKVTTITIKDAAGTKTATINDGADGAAGKDGTSVTVKSVSTSSADGGSNVVTFSDGKTLTIKNGSKGSPGADGPEGPAGEPGVSPTVSVIKTGKTTSVVIADADGVKTATINDGADGTDGQRGTGILKVKTQPSSNTTTINGETSVKRMSLSTIKSEAEVDEVLVGDTICYSYYLYQIFAIDGTYAYTRSGTSIRGAAGAAGKTPVKGTDYFTETDKTEMVGLVKAAMPTLTMVGTDEDGVEHTWTLYGTAT